MTDIITLDPAVSLRMRFRRAMPKTPQPVIDDPAEPKEVPQTAGHALYMIYRIERVRQGFEEFKWASLDIGQRLVWERVALLIETHRPMGA